MFLVKVFSESDNQANFSRIHHYINDHAKHFAEPPILCDARVKKIKKKIVINGKKHIVERKPSRGIRFYLLKDSNMGQILFLIIKKIFNDRVEILLPETFKIDDNILNWFNDNYRGKAKKLLVKKTVQEINEIQRITTDDQ